MVSTQAVISLVSILLSIVAIGFAVANLIEIYSDHREQKESRRGDYK